MAATPEEIEMAFDPIGFASGMRRTQRVAESLTAVLARAEATWEPHDWSDFDR
jgi:hypothetical protein